MVSCDSPLCTLRLIYDVLYMTRMHSDHAFTLLECIRLRVPCMNECMHDSFACSSSSLVFVCAWVYQ
jgi:hypothetical protein